MKKSIMVAVFTAVLLTIACVTVNVYFPAAEVQQAADKIVGDVYGKQPAPAAPEDTTEQSMLRRMWRELVSPFANEAYAQADINISTPNIRALRASLEERFDSLQPLYDKGIIGITNEGLLEIRSVEGLGLKEKAEANKLVKADNADRENLYSEIAKANDIPSDSVSEIKKLFAVEWRKKAHKGWWIQKDDGGWVQKGSE